MPSQIESISPLGVGLGIGVAIVAVALVGLDYYQPAPAALIATVLLAFAVALHGVKPFGESIAYHLLQAAAFAVWGTIVIITDDLTFIPAVFVVIGLIGVLNYGWQAVQRGIWTPTT
ncbi:hypothetical protein PNP85_09530 [Halobacterium salinarum]|jgi:hypothetical protein|uniref:Uncharacterized protein n=3 Tax=Halobacteriales TaxID=2235 RepID=F7PF54_9EURY|nr:MULTISPECIES: hypothetical protein [Halobacteria]ERJ04622.1 hypothetical protein HLRTI_003405 [Halorhabdus tiamatea SARL4B]MDL0139743.1 hypothetical protein [Halobacterium salinarum]QLH78464.1 hypothetical protein HZS55_14710 [Halosimplex rubrum]CCQ35148.1 hypothetical protein HTIA_p3046 [Halorhabdus tiamatea SARL4B]